MPKVHIQFNKYFNSKEFDIKGVPFSGRNMNPFLIAVLYGLRVFLNGPVVVSSGGRNKKTNLNAGGVEDSSHVSFEAVDIKCKSSIRRFLILKYLLAVGITRIGIYKTHIHFDVSKIKDQYVMWYV